MTKTRSVGVGLVVGVELGRGLEPQGGLAAALLAEDQGRAGVLGAAEELRPGRVVDLPEALALEDRVGLRVLLAERVAADAVVAQELVDLHRMPHARTAKSLARRDADGLPSYPIRADERNASAPAPRR